MSGTDEITPNNSGEGNDGASTSRNTADAGRARTNPLVLQEISTTHGVSLNLQNVVSTFNLSVPVALRTVALKARNAEFNPKRFSAVIMRIREPRATALIFKTGKIVVTGAKSEAASRLAARKFAKVVRKLQNEEVKFLEFKIQNMVASCDVKFPIRLEGLAHAHYRFVKYEPEIFPGLVYRVVDPNVVILIFVTGKLVITGAKSRQDLARAFDKIYPVLKGFRKIFE